MQVLTKIFFSIIIFTLFLILYTCEKELTPVGDNPPEIKLAVEDVGVTEVWLKLETGDLKPEDRITITRNDSTIAQFNNSTLDTLIYDSGLLPNQNYTYTAASTAPSTGSGQGSTTITTMDTTSHDFTWQSWTFGEHSSSVLQDIAIISENDIWAVGEIYLNDSTGQTDPQPYGAIHWNGLEWKLMKVPYHDYGTTIKYPGPLRTVFAFDSNNVYVTSSANLLKWDGNSWTEKAFFMTGIPFGGQVKKMWGSSENDIYCVGNAGAIYHYNGQTWQQIESGTQDTFFDIWGIDDSNSNENPIYLAAFDNLYSIDENNIVNNETWAFIDQPIRSVWFKNKYQVFGCGEKVFKKTFTKEWQVMPDTPHNDIYMISLRGQNVNDIFVIGNFGLTLHYNGTSWRRYFNQNNNMYWSVSYKNNVMVAVGEIWYSSPHEAIILMMNRN